MPDERPAKAPSKEAMRSRVSDFELKKRRQIDKNRRGRQQKPP
jgi:hypothetical protein